MVCKVFKFLNKTDCITCNDKMKLCFGHYLGERVITSRHVFLYVLKYAIYPRNNVKGNI